MVTWSRSQGCLGVLLLPTSAVSRGVLSRATACLPQPGPAPAPPSVLLSPTAAEEENSSKGLSCVIHRCPLFFFFFFGDRVFQDRV
jgi:hypothetical protein